jgi:hypothetical protein
MSLGLARMPLWLISLLYMGCYGPYIAITRVRAPARAGT